MGQKSSCVEGPDHRSLVVSCAEAWSVLYSDTVDNWQRVAASFGFADDIYGCPGHKCDRDSICLKKARTLLHSGNHTIEIQRYKKKARYISYAHHTTLRTRVADGFQLSEIVAAVHNDLILVIFYRLYHQYDATFILINLDTCKIVSCIESPTGNMSIMECHISPDGSRVAVLFFMRKDNLSPFRYELYVFSSKTGRTVNVIHCNKEVRPYVTFDPRYKHSRVVIVNYSDCERVKDGLVLFCLDTDSVVATSHIMLSVIYGGGYFCVNYGRDGRFLILQKISDNMNGVHCYSDLYVFCANSLKLLKHYYASLQPYSTLCDRNYAPVFSSCGTRMCVIGEETLGLQRHLYVSVYQLPQPISLQEQCRISILQSVASPDDVAGLPLPQKMKDFIGFCPEL
ncbi:hypothetical protein NP493_388g02028 [Ridgeia piscesae]|uniref:SOCS box domain-containing protein n=1 Tax=Ridgeia piscesae TaxID=27915 RepID=A0AAD9L2D5_RIDPI|nr:hypothetical protein NP493_388g02028 [Ridgeia piscesae]